MTVDREIYAAIEEQVRAEIAAEIEKQIDPDWPHDDISDTYRHAAMIAKGTI